MQRMEESGMHHYIKLPCMVSYNASHSVENCGAGFCSVRHLHRDRDTLRHEIVLFRSIPERSSSVKWFGRGSGTTDIISVYLILDGEGILSITTFFIALF